jgi:hypothetical protein
MCCLDLVVVCRYVSSIDCFFCGSSWSCIDVVYVFFLASMYVIKFSPCSCSLYLREVLCLVSGSCETSRQMQVNVKHEIHDDDGSMSRNML